MKLYEYTPEAHEKIFPKHGDMVLIADELGITVQGLRQWKKRGRISEKNLQKLNTILKLNLQLKQVGRIGKVCFTIQQTQGTESTSNTVPTKLFISKKITLQ